MKRFIKYVLAMLTMVTMAVCVASSNKDDDEKDGKGGGASGSADIKYAWKQTKTHYCDDRNECSHNITLANLDEFEWTDVTQPFENEEKGVKYMSRYWYYLVITTDGKIYVIYCDQEEYPDGEFDFEVQCYEKYTVDNDGIEAKGLYSIWFKEFAENPFTGDDMKNINLALSKELTFEGANSELFDGFNLNNKKILSNDGGYYDLWERIK